MQCDGRSPFTVPAPSDEWSELLLGFGWLRHLRAALSGVSDDQGTLLQATGYTNAYNFVTNDGNGLAFRRTTAQVLNIVYGGGAASNYLFFPNKLNGTIA